MRPSAVGRRLPGHNLYLAGVPAAFCSGSPNQGVPVPAHLIGSRIVSSVVSVVVAVIAFSASAEISESKRKLIEELLAISGYADMANQMSEQQAYVELMRIRPSYRPMMEFAVSEQRELSDEDKQRLLERLSDFDAFSEQFGTRLGENLDFSKVITDVYYPLYDSAFSEGDLEKMVEFYRTPVGRKTIRQMPAIMQNAAETIDRLVRPVSIRVIQDIVAEERRRVEDD
jgi:hypothetical protein